MDRDPLDAGDHWRAYYWGEDFVQCGCSCERLNLGVWRITRSVQVFSCRLLNTKEDIDMALWHGMFPIAGTSNACNKMSYHFATGNERIRLASWQAAMKFMVAIVNANIEVGGNQNKQVCAHSTTL